MKERGELGNSIGARQGSKGTSINLSGSRQGSKLAPLDYRRPSKTASTICSMGDLGNFSDSDVADNDAAEKSRMNTLPGLAGLPTESHAVERRSTKNLPVCLATLSRQWSIPLETTKDSAELFKQYASLPRRGEHEEILRSGVLHKDAMMQIVCKLTHVSCVNDLTPEVQRVMDVADKNGDGQVDFHEFVIWYHNRAFLECMNLEPGDIENRAVAHRLGISVPDIDYYRTMFEKFDADSSGDIDIDEFRGLLHI